MKKIIVSMSLVLTAMVSFAFTNETRPGLLESFKKEFAGAQNVTWSTEGNYQKATFVMGGHRAIAFFNENNELEGCIRDIFYDQLPITVMKTLDTKFSPTADMIDVREIMNANGTSYLLTVEMDTKKYKVKVSSTGNILELEKLVK